MPRTSPLLETDTFSTDTVVISKTPEDVTEEGLMTWLQESGLDIELEKIQRISDTRWQLSPVQPGEVIRMVDNKKLGNRFVRVEAYKPMTPQKNGDLAATRDVNDVSAATRDINEVSSAAPAEDAPQTASEEVVSDPGASPDLTPRVMEPASPSSFVSIDDEEMEPVTEKPPIVGGYWANEKDTEKIANPGIKRGAISPADKGNKSKDKKKKVTGSESPKV